MSRQVTALMFIKRVLIGALLVFGVVACGQPETASDEAAAARKQSLPHSLYIDVHGYFKLGAELVNSESS